MRSGPFSSRKLWKQISADCLGAAVARRFKELRFGLIGHTYPGMSDVPIDEFRLITSTGKQVVRPEVEEIEEAYKRVTEVDLERMYAELRELYDVDETVTNEHMTISAKLTIAYEEVIRKHNISGFGYYWWGEKKFITALRSESAVAVSRLSSMGCPVVTEGDIKTAMAMKIMDLMGCGGMFGEAMVFPVHRF